MIPIAASDVAIAGRSTQRPVEEQERHDHDPAADAEERAEEARRRSRSGRAASAPILHGWRAPRSSPASPRSRTLAALLLDVDGTLAPIVDRPEDAAVPEATRELVRELASRYALVACVSGRVEEDARRVVGLDEVVYVGEHGMGLDPHAARLGRRARAAARSRPPGSLSGSATRPRSTTGPPRTRTRRSRPCAGSSAARSSSGCARAGAGRCSRCSRRSRRTRAPRCARCSPSAALRRALYAGDDATDLEAFRGLDGLEVAVRVAVVSEEGPSALGEAADLVVGSTEALVELLRRL